MIVKPKKNLMLSFTCKEAQCMVSLSPHQKYEASRDGLIIHVNYSDFYKSELPASTTTALATMLRNSMTYTMSTGV